VQRGMPDNENTAVLSAHEGALRTHLHSIPDSLADRITLLEEGSLMTLTACADFASITSSNRSTLQSVPEAWCEERNLPMSDPTAEVAASELLDLYDFGTEAPDALLELTCTI